MKKTCLFLTILMALLLTVTVFPVSASESRFVTVQMELIQDGALSTPTDPSNVVSLMTDTQALEEYLYESLSAAKTQIDISSFSLTPPDLSAAMHRVINNHPDLFFVGRQYSYYHSNSRITSVLPQYTMSGQDLATAKAIYHSKMAAILSLVDESWSDLETVLFFNDYLASHFEYDQTYTISDAYSFLTQGTGVCQAYYLTCKALLDAVGIPSCSASSEQADHIWNMVQLDGAWYHLDVTWNDPIADRPGAARHNHFLISSQKMCLNDPEKSDWISDISATANDPTYDSYYWTDVTAPYAWLNGMWYYSDSDAIRETPDPLLPGTLLIGHDLWYVVGDPFSYWPNSYSGLGTYDNWLIYNTADEVIGYDPITKESRTVYRTPDDTQDLYGSLVKEDTVVCALDVTPLCNTVVKTAVPLNVLDLSIRKDQKRTHHGVTIYEGDGVVTILGKPSTSEPFLIFAAGYNEHGKMTDVNMISSTELNGQLVQWTLTGEKVNLILTTDSGCPIGHPNH